jgi:hypothetical protein
MKRICLSFLLALLLATSALAAPQYIASKLREPFHVTSCEWTQKINSANAVRYETREAAIRDGHRLCEVCSP